MTGTTVKSILSEVSALTGATGAGVVVVVVVFVVVVVVVSAGVVVAASVELVGSATIMHHHAVSQLVSLNCLKTRIKPLF